MSRKLKLFIFEIILMYEIESLLQSSLFFNWFRTSSFLNCFAPLRQAKTKLLDCIDAYINEKITLAAQVISEYASEKISDGDIILIYGW